MTDPFLPPRAERQPIFNLPGVVVAILGVLLGIHVLRTYVIGEQTDFELVLALAFIPARIAEPAVVGAVLPGGEGAAAWTFLTYALLHADWSHLVFNSLWLAAFGSPLAWRFGTARFLLFSAAGAIGGAAAHLAVHPTDMTPMVGASAAISAYMAAASRFVFSGGGPLGGFQRAGPDAYRRPALRLGAVIRDRRVLMFLAVWFGLNIVFGLFAGNGGLTSGAIAWEAHIGGFVVGLLLFSLFDPIGEDPPA